MLPAPPTPSYFCSFGGVGTKIMAFPTQLGVIAVYALNDEFKSLVGETKNGMLSGFSYVVAKSCLSLPIMYIFALFSLGVSFYGIIGAPKESFMYCTVLWAAISFCFESVAECLSVWFDDPILGMLQFMNFWYVPVFVSPRAPLAEFVFLLDTFVESTCNQDSSFWPSLREEEGVYVPHACFVSCLCFFRILFISQSRCDLRQ